MCLNETWLKPSDKLIIKNYETIRKDRASAKMGGGVCILVNRRLCFEKLDIQIDEEVLILKIIDFKYCFSK